MNDKQENIFNNLMNQIRKIQKHNRQGSIKTKQRYFEANKRVCKFLAESFSVQKFANISDKHIKAYTEDLKSRGLSSAYIKTDLGAIRFYHGKVDNAKNSLCGNSDLQLTKRKFGGVDRAWSDNEFLKFKEVCQKYGNERVEAVSTLARNEGLRIHETLKVNRSHVEEVMKTGKLFVQGKGGRIRYVPLSEASKAMLIEIISDISRGDRIFIREGEKHHLVEKQIQNFIARHRTEWQDEGRTVNRTFHGLRHAYARERYDLYKSHGKSDFEARLLVSNELGHGRDEVTRIYLFRGK